MNQDKVRFTCPKYSPLTSLIKTLSIFLSQLVVYLCVCVCVCVGVCVCLRGTLLNPFKPNQLKINLVSYLALISQVSQNKKQVPLQGWTLGVSAFQQMLKLIQDSKGLSSL